MRISAKQHASAWYLALSEAPNDQWSAISERFLTFLHHHDKWGELSDILHAIEKMEEERRGVVSVTVRTARPVISAETERHIQRLVGAEKILVNEVLDPSCIGGIRIETENSRWDFSVAGALKELHTQLIN